MDLQRSGKQVTIHLPPIANVFVVSQRQLSLLFVGSRRPLALKDNLRDDCASMMYEAQTVTFELCRPARRVCRQTAYKDRNSFQLGFIN
jgi:hypothetical protein